jgi:hypothetical protein
MAAFIAGLKGRATLVAKRLFDIRQFALALRMHHRAKLFANQAAGRVEKLD